jgi:PAS domain S-box-containing protein
VTVYGKQPAEGDDSPERHSAPPDHPARIRLQFRTTPMADLDHPFVDGIASRLSFETMVADLSTRLINLPAGEIDHEVEDALRRVCEPLSIDYAVLWQWSTKAPKVLEPSHVYPAGGPLEPPNPLSQDQYPWVVEQVLAGRVVAVPSLDELPAEAAVDRESARLRGIKSSLCIPLSVGGAPPIGALAFNTLQEQHAWPDALVNRLDLVAQVFANALARKSYELSLEESTTRLAAGADLAELAFYEVDFGKGAMYTDDRLRRLCGIPPGREDGLQQLEFWIEHLHPDDLRRVLDMRDQLHDGRLNRFSVEYRYLHPADGERWVRHLAGCSARDAAGRAVRTYGVLRDITERRQVEDELQELSRLLIRAHEEERALLARELHDDVTQRLAVLAIDVGRAELAAPDGAQATAMRSVREGLVRLSEDIHSLAYQLHPSVLEELGLAEALRAECDRVRRRSRFDLSLELEPLPAAIARDLALCLFRVAQEALNNVARHSGARAAVVTLRQVDGGLLLAVRDDGVGFDAASAGRRRSLGLASMRERVRLAAGTLDIESAPGRGTQVVAWVPTHGES